MRPTLLAVGLTTLDIVVRPVEELSRTERATMIEGIACIPAGTAGGTAMNAARLGLEVAVAGAVGADLNGAFVRQGFQATGVDTSLLATDADRPTSATLLAVESSGRRSSYHAIGAGSFAVINDDIRAAAAEARYLHYGGIGGAATNGGPGVELLRLAQASGATITCDLVTPREGAREEVARLLPFVDYFMPSAAEARSLSDLTDLREAAEHFVAQGAKACIIKNSTDGCHIFIDGEHRALPAYSVDAIDTTSCGDSFCAGFIAALSRDWDPVEACRFGSMTAALVAQGLGTLGKVESFDHVVEAMQTTPIGDC